MDGGAGREPQQIEILAAGVWGGDPSRLRYSIWGSLLGYWAGWMGHQPLDYFEVHLTEGFLQLILSFDGHRMNDMYSLQSYVKVRRGTLM